MSWTIAPVEEHAPKGVWDIKLPSSLRAKVKIVTTASSLQSPTKRTVRLFGREALMKEAVASLDGAPFLLVYGLRGNGKTAMIE